MARIFLVVTLGAVLFLGGAWYMGLLNDPIITPSPTGKDNSPKTAGPEELGKDLYPAKAFDVLPVSHRAGHPIILHGYMNPFETEEVGCQVPGKIAFIGDMVDDAVVLAAGSTAFLAEPYEKTSGIYNGRKTFVKFYRRIYEGDKVHRDQMLAMLEPAKALGEVLGKIAKVAGAKADYEAAVAGEVEGKERYIRAEVLYRKGAIAKEEFGSAKLTYEKLVGERKSKYQAQIAAEVDKDGAEIELKQHEIRAAMPYSTFIVKNITRQRGASVKPTDTTIMTVQSLERLLAEAMIEEQYYRRLKDREFVTATIEPTVLDAPIHEFPGHLTDVTCVAVARDNRIVSGSEDKTVCVWKIGEHAPVKKMDHDSPIRVIACTPAASGTNVCLTGCDDGSIVLWDLDAKDHEPIKPIKSAHGNDAAITSLAFSPDGQLFASGASDGTIQIWNIDGSERYAFVPEHGVAQAHDDAVTSLHFTRQCRLVSAGRDKTLRVWKLKEKGAIADGKAIRDRDGNVAALGVSHDGNWMLYDQAQGQTLKMLSTETHILKHTLNLPTNAQPFQTLALFSPDDSLILTAGASEGRLQLWKTPDANSRGFEVRQFATSERLPVSCAAFSPTAGKEDSFIVSASGHKLYVWAVPTPEEVAKHRIENVRMTVKTFSLDPATHQARVGFEIENRGTPTHPYGRFEAGRPVTIVIEGNR